MTTMGADDLLIRTARDEDEEVIARIDREAWSWLSDVVPRPEENAEIFDDRRLPEQFLVAELDGEVVGHIRQAPPTPLVSNRHVRQIQGLAVSPDARGRGVGQALVEAACAVAKADGIRKMTLRVLGHNAPARRLYERCGFVVDGVLPEEFWIDGRYVDDIWMGRPLAS
ncbi:N-acetyltransferase family protein [Kitasatospora sp. NPDC001664]